MKSDALGLSVIPQKSSFVELDKRLYLLCGTIAIQTIKDGSLRAFDTESDYRFA